MKAYAICIKLSLAIALGLPVHASFTVNDDGTVTDSDTKLVWDQCSWGQSKELCATGTAGRYTWYEALRIAVDANEVGYKTYKDWRIPNIKELESIVVLDRSPRIDEAAFPNTPSNFFWSSTYDHEVGVGPWRLEFSGGSINSSLGDITPPERFYVRLVRGGQSFSDFDAFCTTCVSPVHSSVSADPLAVKVYNGDNAADATAIISVQLWDYNDQNHVDGKTVYLQSNPLSAIEPSQSVSNAEGIATFKVNNTVKGPVTYTAIADGKTLEKQATVSFEPAVQPGRPKNVSGVPASQAVTITWVKPQLDGGDPITGYTVTAAPGGKTCTAGAQQTSCTVDGLNNFTPYTFTVKATNKNGDSLASDPPVSATPIPGCPVGNSSFVANPARILANNLDTATLTATLVDAKGVPVANRTVLLSQGGGQSQITPATQLKTNGQGVATFQVKNAKVEVVNYTLSLPNSGEEYPTCSYTLSTSVEFESNLLSVASVQCGDKEYDGNNEATLTGCTLDKSPPNVACAIAASPLNKGAFDHGKDFTEGQAKPVSPRENSIVLSGSDARRYKLFTAFPKASCKINQRRLTSVLFDIDPKGREYDATTEIKKELIRSCTPQGLITGDTVSCDLSAVTANLRDKNAGSNKPMDIRGLKLTGTDGGNYAVQAEYTGTVNITKKALKAASVDVGDRIYGGQIDPNNNNIKASLKSCTLEGVIADDAVTCSVSGPRVEASFGDPNADALNQKPVEVNGLSHIGIDASNYSFDGKATGSARIFPYELPKAGVKLTDRVYAGQHVRDVMIETCTIEKPFPGDDIGCDPTKAEATLDGDGRYSSSPKPVTVTKLQKNGQHANNYIFLDISSGEVRIDRRPVSTEIKPDSLDYESIFKTTKGQTTESLKTSTRCKLIGAQGSNSTGLLEEDIGLICQAEAFFKDRAVGSAREIDVDSIRQSVQLVGNASENYRLDKEDISRWIITGTITELSDCDARKAAQENKFTAEFFKCSNVKIKSFSSAAYSSCVAQLKADIMEPAQSNPTQFKAPYKGMKGYPDPWNGCSTRQEKDRLAIANEYVSLYEQILGGKTAAPAVAPMDGTVFETARLWQGKSGGRIRRLRSMNEFTGTRLNACLDSVQNYRDKFDASTRNRLGKMNKYSKRPLLNYATESMANDILDSCNSIVESR